LEEIDFQFEKYLKYNSEKEKEFKSFLEENTGRTIFNTKKKYIINSMTKNTKYNLLKRHKIDENILRSKNKRLIIIEDEEELENDKKLKRFSEVVGLRDFLNSKNESICKNTHLKETKPFFTFSEPNFIIFKEKSGYISDNKSEIYITDKKEKYNSDFEREIQETIILKNINW